MNEVRFKVRGYPPAKNRALSMLGAAHPHSPRVIALLEAARVAIADTDFRPFDGPIGLEIVLHAPAGKDPWDATNYLGGIGDVLEQKGRRGVLAHLGQLTAVALYTNDRLIREVHYRQQLDSEPGYAVRVFRLDA